MISLVQSDVKCYYDYDFIVIYLRKKQKNKR